MDRKPLTPEQAKQLISQWKIAAPALEMIREEDIRNADTVRSMQTLASCFNMALRELPPREGSGLVEMQRLFAKARQRSS